MNRVKNCVFLVRKWSYTTFNTVNIRKMWEKKGEIRRTRLMTKKRSSEIFTLKMEIFPEIGPQKFLFPRIRRQVSAHEYSVARFLARLVFINARNKCSIVLYCAVM